MTQRQYETTYARSYKLSNCYNTFLISFHLTISRTSTIRATNQHGEIIFKYLRDLFECNYHTRMCYVEAG